MTRSEDSDTPRRSLDPSPERMRQTGYELIDRMVEHFQGMRELPVIHRATPAEQCAAINEPLPEDPADLSDCLERIFRSVVPEMTRVGHPRFHAYIPAPSSFSGALGAMVTAVTNPFVGTWLGGATVTALEVMVVRWLAEMVGYDSMAAGILTSGGSMANLTGLAAAKTRWTDRDRRPRIYVSAEGHASVNRAARVLGFSDKAIHTVTVDGEYRLCPASLKQAIEEDRRAGDMPLCVVGNAGTTNLGVVDPLLEIAAICREFDLWLHVDAAYGGFAALTDSGRELLQGMTQADSLTLDPHKWLYCPLGVGCLLVRDQTALRTAFASSGNYLRDLPPEDVNLFELGPELSRPGRVFPVWMVIRSAGRRELAHQIEEDMRLARVAAELLREDDRLEVISPTLSVVGFRHRLRDGESEGERTARDSRLLNALTDSGELMISSTLVNGQSTLRLVVMNHRTTEDDVLYSVSRIRLHAV